MILAFSGIIVMLAEALDSGSIYGNFMALIAAFCFSIYAVLIRGNRKIDMLPVVLLSSMMIIASCGALKYDMLVISKSDLLLCFLWGGIFSGYASACFIFASRHIRVGEVTLIAQMEVALGPIWVWIFINEGPSQWTLTGGALVISAIVGRWLLELKHTRKS